MVLRHKALRRVLPLLLVTSLSLPALAAAQAARSTPEKAYTIATGDGLSLLVWREPELTRDVTVRLDGKISVPLLGDVQAAGRTPEQLGTEIAAGLKRFLSAPQVTVSIREANGSRFFVMGRVARPGVYPLAGRTTVLQALALAGGLAEFAKAERILLIREDQGSENAAIINYKKLEAGTEIAQNNVVLRPGDTILVP